jgi:hypothetical protein
MANAEPLVARLEPGGAEIPTAKTSTVHHQGAEHAHGVVGARIVAGARQA